MGYFMINIDSIKTTSSFTKTIVNFIRIYLINYLVIKRTSQNTFMDY